MMDNKEIFNKLLYCKYFPEEDLSKAQNILKQVLEEMFDHYEKSNKTMKNCLKLDTLGTLVLKFFYFRICFLMMTELNKK